MCVNLNTNFTRLITYFFLVIGTIYDTRAFLSVFTIETKKILCFAINM